MPNIVQCIKEELVKRDRGGVSSSSSPIGRDSFASCVNSTSFVNSSCGLLGSGTDGGHGLFITHMIVRMRKGNPTNIIIINIDI